MARIERPDGTEIHWEKRGGGPTVMLAPYWSGHAGVFEELVAELARDLRVVTWDARGTGRSTRRGPYDMETDCADLEAVLEHVGRASVIALADGVNKACRVGASRPELVDAVIALGAGPFARGHFDGTEGMIGSEVVVEAFIEMVERDYRGALRTLLTATNSQMSEQELRGRVASQIAYCPQQVGAARVRAWSEDDPTGAARAVGDRLWILSAPDIAGSWLPPPEERRRIIEAHMPRAHLYETEPGVGPLSNPDLVAERIREIAATAAPRAA
jgi:pimeloyl-ACP methyl ester carboxylesterase